MKFMENQTEKITKKNRGGRPRKSFEDSRVVPVYFCFTPSEMSLINKRAGSIGLTRAEFCRNTILHRPITTVPQINKDAYQLLANVSNNLNQLTKLAHQTQNEAVASDSIKQVLETVRLLRAQLIEVPSHDSSIN